jgi:hypothetical protein
MGSVKSGENPSSSIGSIEVHPQTTGAVFVHGTSEDDDRRRIVGQHSRFHCPLTSAGSPHQQGLLDYFVINDGYCDCPGSGFDEPGTSACAGLASSGEPLFFCGAQDGRHIFSSRVEDGICDCCDGSDEELSEESCKNTCAELLATRRLHEENFARGRAKGAEMLRKSPSLVELFSKGSKRHRHRAISTEQLQAVFDSTTSKLVEGEYTYEITPQSGVTQSSNKQKRQKTSLGKGRPTWDEDSKILHYGGGARCPNGVIRSIDVFLECSSTGASGLIRVSEKQTCVYTATFATPLGCI